MLTLNKRPYLDLNGLLDLIPTPMSLRCWKILNDYPEQFKTTPGSSHNHQAWEGGYLDHIREVMNLAAQFFQTLNELRPLNFALEDALLVLFLHDVEKPWKKELNLSKAQRPVFRDFILDIYEIELTEQQAIAFRYVEGENDDYTPERRVMNELGAFCHLCDLTSARIWHDRPKADEETWGARGSADAL